MDKKKIIIISFVIFIILVAIIALFLKARPQPEIILPSKKIDTTETEPVSNSTSVPNPGPNIIVLDKNEAGEFIDSSGDAREVDTSFKSDLPVFIPPAVVSAETADPSLSAIPNSPAAPKQEVVEANEIPAKAIKIDMTALGFSPREFRVKPGTEVTLALSSSDGETHVFIFPLPSLMGLTTMVLGGEIKTITFKVPSTGSYAFRDDIPRYRMNTGTMIVE